MQTRKLGGLDVSLVGLGCNNFGSRCDAEATKKVVDAAIEQGINFFDTADVYGRGASEELLSKALGQRRPQVLIATKFGAPMSEDESHRGGSKKWIDQAVADSLRRLNTDYIDLYQIHVPDDKVEISETLGALSGLVSAGKVREIGCSNFSADQINEALGVDSSANFVSVQNHWNLLHRDPEPDVVQACEKYGLGILPYFPLASGLLTGKYEKDKPLPQGTRLAGIPEDRRNQVLTDEVWTKVEGLSALAKDRGHTSLDLAISWLAAQSVVSSVIAGATKPEQVRANVAAASWKLDDSDFGRVDEITRS